MMKGEKMRKLLALIAALATLAIAGAGTATAKPQYPPDTHYFNWAGYMGPSGSGYAFNVTSGYDYWASVSCTNSTAGSTMGCGCSPNGPAVYVYGGQTKTVTCGGYQYVFLLFQGGTWPAYGQIHAHT
jgi:hypothetical protein